MRLLILILLFPFIAQGQIVRTHPYYRPPTVTSSCTYILDTYTGAAGAYSVAFKLRTAYSGSAFRVRRSNDNSEQDIGFSGCAVDTASLKSFVGANSGYIVTLYDQVGSNNVTQSTASAQARIVNAGVVERVSGKPSMYFDGGDSYNFAAFAGKTRMDFYFLTSTSDNTYLHFYSGVSNYGMVAQDASASASTSNFGTPVLYTNNYLTASTTRNNVYDALNGISIVTIQNSTTSVWGTTCNFGNYGGGFEYTGYLSQVIGWDSDQSANRTGIYTAFNTQFSIYVSGTEILDTYRLSAGAYSVAFKLRSSYTGAAFRVRETGGGTETDIGFVGSVVDTSALKAFCGSNSGYIVTLYDQQGSSNVTQSTTTSQARIVNAGVIERVSGQPSMYFDGGDSYNFSAFAADLNMDFYFVASTSDATYMQFYGDNANEFGFLAQNGNGSSPISNFGTPSLYANGTLQTSTTRDNVHDALNGTYIVTIQGGVTLGWGTICGLGTYGVGFEFTGYISQIIGWEFDQSSNRSSIVTAFNTQFGIY